MTGTDKIAAGIIGVTLVYCLLRAALDYFGIVRWGKPHK